jgi:hypothetical protein
MTLLLVGFALTLVGIIAGERWARWRAEHR